MSLDSPHISPISQTHALASTDPASATRSAATPQDDSSVIVDAIPATPPPEVLHAIGAAADAYDRLSAGGVQLQFRIDEQTGKVTTNVIDLHGTVLGTLSPSQVLDAVTTGTLS